MSVFQAIERLATLLALLPAAARTLLYIGKILINSVRFILSKLRQRKNHR